VQQNMKRAKTRLGLNCGLIARAYVMSRGDMLLIESLPDGAESGKALLPHMKHRMSSICNNFQGLV
jgi:hypothetical protein